MAWNPLQLQADNFYRFRYRDEVLHQVLYFKSHGDTDWERKNINSAIGCYSQALRLCEEYDFSDLKADLHWRMAAVYLDFVRITSATQNVGEVNRDINKWLNIADKHVNKCIAFDGLSAKGFQYRAELKCLRAERLNCQPHPSTIEDFVKAYKLQGNSGDPLEPLCQALFIAVDSALTGLLTLDFLSVVQCSALLKAVLSHDHTVLEHIEYLIHAKDGIEGSGLASRLSVSFADLSLASLHSKWYSSEKIGSLVKLLIEKGMQLTTNDVKIAIQESKDLELLKLVMENAPDFTDTEVCELCLSCQNFPFASHFLSVGAKPSHKSVIENMMFPYKAAKSLMPKQLHDDFLSYLEADPGSHEIIASKALSCNCFDTFKQFTPGLTSDSIKSLCEQALVKRKKKFFDYLMKKHEANPNAVVVIDSLAWHDLDKDLLEYLVCIPSSHQEMAARAISHHDIEILRKFALLLDKESCSALCEQALVTEMSIAVYLMKNCNANPRPSAVIDALDWDNLDEAMLDYLAAFEAHTGALQLIVRAIQRDRYDIVTRFAMDLKPNESICDLIKLYGLLQTTNLASHPDVFERLLEIGADPNCGGSENEGRPLDVALTLDISAKVQIITSLVKHGADLSLCTTAEPTLIHVVTELAFESSNSDVLEVVCKVYKFPEDGKLVDKSDKTPFHLAMKHKQGRLCEKMISILCQYCIDPDILDDHGQKAYYVVQHGKGKGDKRVKLLQEHSRKFKEAQKRKMPKKSKARSRNANSISQTTAENNEREKSPKKEEVAEAVTESSRESENSKLSESEQLKDLLDMLHSKKDSYFKGSQQPYKRQASSHESNSKGASTHIEPHNKDGGAALPIKKEEVETDKALEVRFEDLVWEVECPEKVVKFLKNERHPAWLRELAITKIRQLAEGDLRGNGIKPVYKDASRNFCLYEMRLTDAARILWERAVQFSPRLTAKGTDKSCETAKGSNKSCEAAVHLYSEVIRVWDIVLDHDNVNRSISYVKKSNERGCKAAVKYHLKNPKPIKSKKARNQEQKGLQYPEVYLVGKDIDQQEVAKIAERIFVPAGSTKEDEYNVITFYSFTSSFVKSLLEGEHARRDFPYKEWPKEHDIINMPQHEESILLLGRSGTGKTTCCLYRLWNHFQTYWLMAENSGPTFPRAPLTLLANQVTEACAANADSELDSSSGSITELDPSQDVCTTDTAAQPEDAQADEELEADEEPRPKNILEHLHQVFITKNYVLCAQMKKRFYDLAAGNDIAKEHMQYEDVEETPINISDLNDQAYPIFLTARQFFILLDNSLEDGKQFFPRDEGGKLKEKIISSDYDHENPDTLLDLEESDSEEEMDDGDDFEDEARSHRTAKKQQVPERKEVTAFYFAEKIWSEIKHASSEKKLDPLLVWMEIKSFIKGSKDALQCEEGFLSEESYIKLIGEKRASNFVGKREELYKLFKAYDRILKLTATESLFDDCDFIHNIHTRLDMMQDLPWSIHSIYIDEVQDFTQAELALLLRCCRHPNGLFLTGDTAQSIMRGIAFRFSDLRTLFHDANEKAKAVKGAIPVKVPKVHELTINFRSHSGILELASSIIDLLRNFFPDSFDSLPGDEGMFQGPVPVLLESSSISDLAILLRGNKRQSSSIEFGAHQVIIVQSEEAKQSLPDALKAGNVLTVFESKGLEFDDVILYDFFKNSKVTKEWRVITTFIENDPRLKKRNKSDFASEPRSLKFDELQHKSLNAELKYLYTAITRAKCNLWIYDSDQLNRLPMFDYWVKRELVKVVNVDLTKDDQNVLFAVQSSKDEWKIQGDYFKKKGLWEPAMKCYWKAGNVRLEKETEAYFLAKQAKTFSQKPKEMQLHFLRAAIAFLECDKSSHDVSCLEKAAKCLKNSKNHSEAAKLYTRLNQPDKAAAQFKRSNDIDGYVKFKEMNGQYNEAVQLYVKKNRRLEALRLAEGYEQNGITLSHGLAAIDLALKFAKFYTEKGNTERLLKVVDYIPDVPVQVDILKKAGMFKEACDLLVGAKQFSEAYQLYRVQGEYQAAIELAVKQKDQEKQEKLTLWYAISLLAKDSGKLDAAVNHSLIQISKSSANREHKALAYLLLGRINKDVGFCKQASRLFANLKVPHTVGQMEACVAQLEFEKVHPRNRDDDVRNVLHACQLVSTVSGCCRSKESKRTPTQTNTIHQMEVLYSLERHQSSYACFKEEITFWMGRFKPHQCSDSDGQLVVTMEDVMALVIQRMNGVIERWIANDGLEVVQHLKTRAKSFPFNEQLSKSGHLRKSFLEYPHNEVTSYLRVCNDAAEVKRLSPNSASFSSEIIVRVILNFLSPPASMYMPISKAHLRRLCNISDALKSFLNAKARELQATSDIDFNMDRWLEVWRIHCAFETVPDLEYHFTGRPRTSEKAYYFYQDGSYDHYLALWLRSCRLIAKESKVITSFKIAVHFIVKRFAQKSEIRATLSTANLLHILCIHSTALLAVSKVCADRLHKKSSRVYVPSLYVHVVRIFDLMNCYSQDRKTLFQACFEDGIVIKEAAKGPQFLHKLLRDVQNHLREVLGILTGSTYPQLRPLHSVMTEESIANGDAKHCVMLTLTLFANLALTDCTDEELHQLRVQIKHAIQPLLQQTGAGSELLKKSYSLFAGQNSIAGTFMALDQLLTSVGSNTYVAEMTTSYKERKPPTFSFSPVTFPHYPRRTVTPLPVIEIRDNIKFPERTDSTRNVWGVKRSISQPANPQESVKTESVVETTQVEHSSSAELPESKASLELKENLEGIENDEDVQEALKLAASAPLARKPTQEAIAMPLGQDQSLIDDNFCQICAVALQAKKEVVEPELPTLKTEEQHEEPTSPVVTIERSLSRDSEEVETPDAHCKSQKHIEQCKLRDRYLRQRSEEYLPLKTKLMEMKETLASFDIQFALKTVLVQIEKEIENNEKYFETIELSAEWREGCSKIDYEIIGRVESLLQTSEKELEKAKKVRDHESKLPALPVSEDEEDVVAGEERLEEVEEPASSAVQQKGRSRARKRHKNSKKRK